MQSIEAVTHSQTEIASILNPFWDYGPRDAVERELLSRLQQQLSTLAVHTKAFRNRVPSDLLTKQTLTRADLERLPLVSKQELRALGADDLLADPDEVFHVVRGTGGTTGTPVTVCWTRADWRALTHALQRFCGPLQPLCLRRVWNGYNQGHVSGPAFDDLIRALGATPVPRHFRATDAEAIAEIERLRADALVITPKSGSGKGGSLEDLLSADPNLLARLKIRALFVSSTRLEYDLVQELREQGVTAIVNFYGSTEAPPAAVSCEVDPTVFHLSQGHVLVEVVGPDRRQVKSGERGMVVVSRIGSEGPTGMAPARGTQLIRYIVGDMALYQDEPCACGRSSARIRDVVRFTDLEDKLKGGCERWE